MSELTSSNPVKPSEFLALVPEPEDGLCAVLVKFFKFIILHWKWQRWAFDHETGAFTEEFIEQLCAAKRTCNEPQTD